MITIFNRKRLSLDTDSKEAARVWSILKANGIKYTMVTKGVMPSALRSHYAKMEAGMYNGAMNYSKYRDINRQFVYIIYVRRKDYARAAELIN